MKTTLEPTNSDTLRHGVREHYAKVAEASGCGCSTTCCTPGGPRRDAAQASQTLGYSAEQTGVVPEGANLGLGCGNPLAIASLQAGQTVLDLGSGAGFDTFLAARAVGPLGRAIGVDMTPAMLTKARANAMKSGLDNTEFRLGEIENLPVSDASVDVILSNCVINLSPDKARVFAEAARVLKPGGRLAISDVVALKPVPDEMKADMALYAGCASGSALIADLEQMLAQAGFEDIRITPKPESREVIREWFPGKGLEDRFASATIEAVKPLRA
ncbi:MAG: arsenite methyltransferase [Prosthecobacter sp.]|nr:arsenite methyltransferase [Prosthecobacter sp.]